MKVYVIRHGESENNLKGLWTGWDNPHLTEKGIEDAKKAGKFLEGISFDKVYSSDLKRAMETMENAIHPKEYETSVLLREINVGKFAGNPYASTTDEEKKCIVKNGYTDFGGESNEDFKKRVTEFMKSLESDDCENIAVFCHAGWMREMLGIVLDTFISKTKICCNNCTIAIYEYIDGNWKLYSWNNL